MKTSLDIVDIVFGYLSPTPFSSSLSGKVYKHKKPINSKLEDVVIATIGAVNADMETAVVNVNIHVPDIMVAEGGGVNEMMPDHLRLNVLAKAILPYLDKWANGAGFSIQQQNLFEDPDAGQHYINFRLNFYSINILN